MKTIRISHAGGVGDGIMFSSIIKEKYCKEYDMVYLDVQQGRLTFLFDKLYNDTSNIIFGYSPADDFVKLQFSDAVNHPSWRNLKWERDSQAEDQLYQQIVDEYGEDYIITHERSSDNMHRKMYPINRNYFETQNCSVINVDGRHGHILDYVKVLQNAKEIHVYEGSFMNLADSITNSVPLYGHLYCKPHYFDPKMVHHQIIENIKAGKWHKNKWNYLWEISETLI